MNCVKFRCRLESTSWTSGRQWSCSGWTPEWMFLYVNAFQVFDRTNGLVNNVKLQVGLLQEITVYPDKQGTVRTILEEARKQVELSKDGSGQLRFALTFKKDFDWKRVTVNGTGLDFYVYNDERGFWGLAYFRLVHVSISPHNARIYQVFPIDATVTDVSHKFQTQHYAVRAQLVNTLDRLKIAFAYQSPVSTFSWRFVVFITFDETPYWKGFTNSGSSGGDAGWSSDGWGQRVPSACLSLRQRTFTHLWHPFLH